ncbi:MAG TPA: hypothetical protein VGK27_12535 [Candidatus Deferrimicrobiaceae bacterium]|jgi:hypothetical protein
MSNIRRRKRIKTFFPVLFSCLLWIGSTGNAFAKPFLLGRESAAPLWTTRSLLETHDRLAADLPAAGGKLLILSRTDFISSLLLPLKEEGLLKNCILVLPFDNVLTQARLVTLLATLKQDGVGESDRAGFTLDNGTFHGKIGGMPVTFTTLPGIPDKVDLRVVAIESAFFQDMQNAIKNPMTVLARKLLLTFRDRQVETSSLLLLDAVGRSDYPLELGYLEGLYREMLTDPDRFATGFPPKWGDFVAAELAYFFSQYPEAFEHYKKFLEQGQNDPSTCIKIAMMAIRDLDVPFALQWVNRAVSTDPLYRRAYAEIAEYLFGKNMFDQAERVILAGLAKYPKDPLLATGLATFYVARGEAALESGDTESAKDHFMAAAEVGGADREIVEKARKLMNSPSKAKD